MGQVIVHFIFQFSFGFESNNLEFGLEDVLNTRGIGNLKRPTARHLESSFVYAMNVRVMIVIDHDFGGKHGL